MILSEWVISRCSLGFLGLILIVLFSAHHLLRIFARRRFGLNSLNLLSEWVISRCSLGFLGLILIVLFSAHHLLRIFAHRRSVTVCELSDYITRRKKSQYLKEVQNGCNHSRIRIDSYASFPKIVKIFENFQFFAKIFDKSADCQK